jgi:hypothetical protein
MTSGSEHDHSPLLVHRPAFIRTSFALRSNPECSLAHVPLSQRPYVCGYTNLVLMLEHPIRYPRISRRHRPLILPNNHELRPLRQAPLTCISNPTLLASALTSSKLSSIEPSPFDEVVGEFSKCHRRGPRLIHIPSWERRVWMMRR